MNEDERPAPTLAELEDLLGSIAAQRRRVPDRFLFGATNVHVGQRLRLGHGGEKITVVEVNRMGAWAAPGWEGA